MSSNQEKQLENVSLCRILTITSDFLVYAHDARLTFNVLYICSYFYTVDHLSPSALSPQTQTATIEEQSAFKFPEVRNTFRSVWFRSIFHWSIGNTSCYTSMFWGFSAVTSNGRARGTGRRY